MSKTKEQPQKGATAEVAPLDHLKDQVAAKPKREETGYVGGRVSSKQMKLYLAYAQPGTGQVRAIKSLCGAFDSAKKKKAA